MQLILAVSCSDEHVGAGGLLTEMPQYTGGCFVVDIDPVYAQRLLGQIAMVKALKALGLGFRLECFDRHGAYYGCEWNGASVSEIAPEEGRTKCDLVRVHDDEVRWQAYAKHTDVYLETEAVSERLLHVIAAGEEAAARALFANETVAAR